jgi:hypothetical protein
MRPRQMLYAFTRRLLRFGVFGLVADAKPMRPAVSAMEEARKGSLGFLVRRERRGRRRSRGWIFPCNRELADTPITNHVQEAEKLAEFIERWQGKASVSAQSDFVPWGTLSGVVGRWVTALERLVAWTLEQ